MSSGIDTAQLLNQILSQNKTDLASLAQKASTPIPGGHVGGIPLTLQPNQQQYQSGPMIPHQPGTDVVGKGNARGIGIGNAVVGVTHALAATETALTNKKKLEVASGTQQLLTAQAAYDQAAALYKQNPQNTDAKSAMDRNMQVMNGILSNDKLRKAIAKGMNIDFTDPSANDTIEHQGVQQGKTMASQHLNYAEQFNQKTPTTMQPNQQAIAQYQSAIEQQKINNEAVKSIIPLISAQLRAASADKRTEGMMTAAKMREIGAAAIQDSKNQAAWNRTLAEIQGRKDLAKDQFGYKLSEIAAEGQKDLATYKEKLEMKNADPMARLKSYNDFTTKSSATIAKLTSTIDKLESDKTIALKNARNDQLESVGKSFDDQINTTKQTLQNYKQVLNSSEQMYRLYAGAEDAGADSTDKSDELTDPDTYYHSGSDDESGSDNPD